MGIFDKLFGKKQPPQEEQTMTQLNIGIILGSTREGRAQQLSRPLPPCTRDGRKGPLHRHAARVPHGDRVVSLRRRNDAPDRSGLSRLGSMRPRDQPVEVGLRRGADGGRRTRSVRAVPGARAYQFL